MTFNNHQQDQKGFPSLDSKNLNPKHQYQLFTIRLTVSEWWLGHCNWGNWKYHSSGDRTRTGILMKPPERNWSLQLRQEVPQFRAPNLSEDGTDLTQMGLLIHFGNGNWFQWGDFWIAAGFRQMGFRLHSEEGIWFQKGIFLTLWECNTSLILLCKL